MDVDIILDGGPLDGPIAVEWPLPPTVDGTVGKRTVRYRRTKTYDEQGRAIYELDPACEFLWEDPA